jgi:glycosyltransferase involved in cell wall biosynthesis
MRVLIVSPYFPPLLSVGSLRAWSFAAGFARAGHEVHVLTTSKRSDQHGLEISDESVLVHEVAAKGRPLLDHVRKNNARPADDHTPGDGSSRGLLRSMKERTGVFSSVRMPDMTDAWVRPAAAWASEHGPWDVVVSSSGPYTAHLVALRLGGMRGRWIADFRDLWTANHQFHGLYPFTMRERTLERRILAQADAVTTVSEPLGEHLRDSGARRVHVIFNGYFETEPEPVSNEPAFADDDLLRLVYTGSIYPGHQDAEPLFRAIASLGDDARRFRVVVAGGGDGYWAQRARVAGVPLALEHRGQVSRPEALRLQRDADALVAIEFVGSSDGVLSGKIFEYLSTQAPIMVLGRPGCVGELVEQTGRGHRVNDDVSIARMLRGLLIGADVGLSRDDDLIGSFSREHQAERMVGVGEHLAGVSAQTRCL